MKKQESIEDFDQSGLALILCEANVYDVSVYEAMVHKASVYEASGYMTRDSPSECLLKRV